MANSKNTIQGIPLNGTLNMNTLKTGVRQFEGFNEKNSTVFGGTLSPFFDKTTTLGSEDNSYTIFNSKGVPYTLTSGVSVFQLFKNEKFVLSDEIKSTKTETLDVPDDTVSAATDLAGNLIYVEKSGKVKWMGGTVSIPGEVLCARIWVDSNLTYIVVVTEGQDHILVVRNGSLVVNKAFNHTSPIPSTYSPLITGVSTGDGGLFTISVLTNSGKLEVKPGNYRNFETYTYTIDYSGKNINSVDSQGYWTETFPFGKIKYVYFSTNASTYECYQFASRTLVKNKGTYFLSDDKACGAVDGYIPCPVGHKYSVTGSAYYLNGSLISIGHKGTPVAPCLSFGDNTVNTIYDGKHNLHVFYHGIDGKWYHYQSVGLNDTDDKNEWLKSLVFDGRYIFLRSSKPYSKETRIYDIETDKIIDNVALDWILDSTPWVNKSDLTTVEESGYYDFENKITLDVTRPNDDSHKIYIKITQEHVDLDFDHEYKVIGHIGEVAKLEGGYIMAKKERELTDVWDPPFDGDATIDIISVSDVDYFSPVSVTIPLGGTVTKSSAWSRKKAGKVRVWDTTGCVFGGGYNAGYAISNSPFVGYLPNPYVVSNFPKSISVNYPEVPQGAQFYCTIGDQAMSAEYVGRDAKYLGTTLAIDSSGNVILPVSSSGKIVSGYSNNDLVRENGASYPLMYWNNSQKIYAYFLLSGIENMTGVFSLQGQQYTVDDNSIYAVSFANGIVQNVQTVCYKKNLRFLGTLPSQAIFWSDFNKTFYSFTGDHLVSKMFEASDIGEVRYVGQNPSSLSLWICTDKGIYILSDTDQYRLDFVCEEVFFIDDSAMVVTESDGKRSVHQISLWDIGNGGEMIPVKLKTAYFGLGSEQKSVMDCWYIRLFDENRMEGEVKARVNTITDVTRHSEEKTFKINPSDYDENNIVYLRYQPKYQECTAMQLELESNIGIYELALGVNATDSTAQIGKLNF